MSNSVEPRKRATFWRLVRELGPPAIAAELWAIVVTYTSGKAPSVPTVISTFGGAWFVASWLFGNINRVHKQLRAENSTDELLKRTGRIDELLQRLVTENTSATGNATTAPKLTEVAATSPATTSNPNAAPTSPPSDKLPNGVTSPFSSPNTQTRVSDSTREELVERLLLSEAEAAAGAGQFRSALVIGGSALEQALRDFAMAHSVVVGRAEPFQSLLQKLRGYFSAELAEDLRRIWDIRKVAAHGQQDTRLEAAAVSQLLPLIRRIAEALMAATANRNAKITGIPCFRCGQPTMGSGGAVNRCGNCGAVSDDD